MINFRQYLKVINGEWLKEWNEMAISYGLTEFMNEDASVNESVSIADQIKVLQISEFPRITRERGIKDYLHAAGEILGIEFNKNVVKIATKRIGAPLSWLNDSLEENSERMKDFLDKVLPTKTKIISINDTITVNGVSYTNESSSYPAFVIDFDVSDKYPTSKVLQYPLILAGLQKQSVRTEYQELGFLFALAGSYVNENDIFNIKTWLNECSGKVFYDGNINYTEKKVKEIHTVAISLEWKQSIINGVEAIRKKLGTTVPIQFHKDSSKFSLNVKAKKLYQNEEYATDWSADKWNASDVWFVYHTDALTKDFGSLPELNNYLKKNLENKSGVIGLSLKKFEKGGSVKEVDKDKSFKEVESFEIKFGQLFTQGIKQTLELIDSSNGKESLYSIDYRLFQGKAGELMTGNVVKKGSEAAHGKVFLQYIDNVTNTTAITSTVKKMRGSGNIEYKNGNYVLTTAGKTKFKLAKRMYKFLKVSSIVSSTVSARTGYKPPFKEEYGVFDQDFGEFETKMNDYINSSMKGSSSQIIKKMDVRLSATFQNIAFGGWWAILHRSKKNYGANEVARKMFFYGMSMADFSSVHLKIGG